MRTQVHDGQKDIWKICCEQRFGRVPECREMSIQELEECLQQCGDDEAPADGISIPAPRCKFLQIFGGLVLGCIEADFCK